MLWRLVADAAGVADVDLEEAGIPTVKAMLSFEFAPPVAKLVRRRSIRLFMMVSFDVIWVAIVSACPDGVHPQECNSVEQGAVLAP